MAITGSPVARMMGAAVVARIVAARNGASPRLASKKSTSLDSAGMSPRRAGFSSNSGPAKGRFALLPCHTGMIAQAVEMGANAIINVRYMTTSVVGSAAELLAYGTAVKLSE